MRILHTADIHLRAPDDERWEALGIVLDKAGELGADVLVVSGDMFDKHVEAERLKTPLRRLFEGCALEVVILPGNHDRRGLGAGDFYGERVAVLADPRQTIDIGDVRIAGLPFEDVAAETVIERLIGLKAQVRDGATNILLYHGELLDMMPGAGAFGDEDEHEYMPVRLSAFAGLGFDYVLAGHFHRGYDVRRYEGGYFAYPGSPVSVTKKEVGIRHADLVETGKPPQAVALDTHHVVDMEVHLNPLDRADPLEEIRGRVSRLHPKAAVYLSVGGFANLDALEMTEKEFEEALRRFENEGPVAQLTTKWRDVSAILDNELFRRFNARLEETDLSARDRDALRDMVIDAFTETMHED
jgi:DNA repair exonuclease SbcCD nuclease subunit